MNSRKGSRRWGAAVTLLGCSRQFSRVTTVGKCYHTAFLLLSKHKREIAIDVNQKTCAKMFVADVLIKGKALENTSNKIDKQTMVFSCNKTPCTILEENKLPLYRKMWMNFTAIKCMCVYMCACACICECV